MIRYQNVFNQQLLHIVFWNLDTNIVLSIDGSCVLCHVFYNILCGEFGQHRMLYALGQKTKDSLHETCAVLVIDNSEKIYIFFSNKDRAMRFIHKVIIYNANIPCEFHEDWSFRFILKSTEHAISLSLGRGIVIHLISADNDT